MDNHPEQLLNEVFLGNQKISDWPNPKFKSLNTIRTGIIAYSIDGEPLDEIDAMVPLFIHRNEYPAYDKIMMDSMSKWKKA